VRKYEDMIGRKFDIVNRYHAFSYRDMTTEKSMAEGRIPMISWKALDGSRPTATELVRSPPATPTRGSASSPGPKCTAAGLHPDVWSSRRPRPDPVHR
jgi:hypothetical protein